jgi:hypothetical protein
MGLIIAHAAAFRSSLEADTFRAPPSPPGHGVAVHLPVAPPHHGLARSCTRAYSARCRLDVRRYRGWYMLARTLMLAIPLAGDPARRRVYRLTGSLRATPQKEHPIMAPSLASLVEPTEAERPATVFVFIEGPV